FDVTNLIPGYWDFGTRGIGIASEHTFFVTNTGGATATALSATAIGAGFAYVGGAYPGSGGSCTTSLSGGGICTINVEFRPVAAGLATGTINIGYQDSAASNYAVARVVRGMGTTLALLEINEKADGNEGLITDFGGVGLGSSADRSFTVWNVGGGEASAISFSLATPFAFAGGSFPGTGGSCGATLASNGTCTVVVRFTPTGATSFTGSLAASYNDGAATQTAARALAGRGIDGALLIIRNWTGGGGGGDDDDRPFDYGTCGIPVDHTFTLVNQG